MVDEQTVSPTSFEDWLDNFFTTNRKPFAKDLVAYLGGEAIYLLQRNVDLHPQSQAEGYKQAIDWLSLKSDGFGRHVVVRRYLMKSDFSMVRDSSIG